MQQFIDPQHFEVEELPNGIILMVHRHPSPVCFMEIILPVGSAHCHEDGTLRPGAVHFLEHALFLQSKNHPQAHQFELELALRGCERNGGTYAFFTRYDIACPLTELSYATKSLLETVYEPIFLEETLVPERGVVQNERDQEKRFYPNDSRSHQYANLQFRHSSWVALEQIFGSNADLESFTTKELARIHQETHFLKGTVVLAVGDSDFSELKAGLAGIKTHTLKEEPRFTLSHWVDKSFRYVEFDDVQHPDYLVSWIAEPLPFEEVVGLRFILSYLTNYTHGILYDEYRKRLGWTYSLSHFTDVSNLETIYGLGLILENKKQIQAVRKGFLELARAGLEDQARVEREIQRRQAYDAFDYFTSRHIVRGARGDIIGGEKTVRTVQEWRDGISRMADPSWRLSLFEKLFNREEMGEMVFMPPK
jgi:predicted Zn-dependent peptidase